MSRFAGPPYNDENVDTYASESREPGARRKKLAGYLRSANELRQNYVQSWKGDFTTGSDFSNAAISSSGGEQLILFPSYAKQHVRSKPVAVPGTIQEVPGTGRDVRDTTGAGDAEFWKQEWERYESDKATVDVDVRGWVFTPHSGQMSRKQRLMIALARQLVGLPYAANKSSVPPTPTSGSRASSPTRRTEEELATREAAAIIKKGEREAEVAQTGGFSERPSGSSSSSLRGESPGFDQPPRTQNGEGRQGSVSTLGSLTSLSAQNSQTSISPSYAGEQSSFILRMNSAELAAANANLLARLKPFMANPTVSTTITVFFYNDKVSRQKTVTTDTYGHFNFRAALDFVPTHLRVLASEHLSVSEEVLVVPPHGVSLISDVDDTVRHSAITKGAREIFRNAFIREFGDLTIDGVKEWYNTMADMGVSIHYVSNSPWQLFPAISNYFSHAGLPKGSFHLKQYSGMLQGIFEPVAERKKATLERLLRDFPARKFVLIGDSGEADLEVYTDVVVEHPGRVLAVYIRDVTTPSHRTGFFDPGGPAGSTGGTNTPRGRQSQNQSMENLAQAAQTARPNHDKGDDEDLKAAIAASLQDQSLTANTVDVLGRAKRLSRPNDIDDDEKDLRAAIAASLRGRHSRHGSDDTIGRTKRFSASHDDNDDDELLKVAIAASLQDGRSKRHSIESLAQDISRAYEVNGNDDNLKAAIAASLKDMEEEGEMYRRYDHYNGTSSRSRVNRSPERVPPLPSRPSQISALNTGDELGDLIDLSDVNEQIVASGQYDDYGRPHPTVPPKPAGLSRHPEDASHRKPLPPDKPARLRSDSNASRGPPGPPPRYDDVLRASPPPIPRKPSTEVRRTASSPLHQMQSHPQQQNAWPESTTLPPPPRQYPRPQPVKNPSRSAVYTQHALGTVQSVLPCTRPILNGFVQNGVGSSGGSSSSSSARPQLTRSPHQSALSLATTTLMSPAAPQEARGFHDSSNGSQNGGSKSGSWDSGSESGGIPGNKRKKAPPPLPLRRLPITSSVVSFAASSASAAASRVGEYWNNKPTSSAEYHNDANANGSRFGGGDGDQHGQVHGGPALSAAGPSPQQQLNKREELWKRRWRRAKEIMDRDGVILRTWRVGSDVEQECIAAVRDELDRQERRASRG